MSLEGEKDALLRQSFPRSRGDEPGQEGFEWV